MPLLISSTTISEIMPRFPTITQALVAKLLTQSCDLRHERGAAGGVACVHRNRHRATPVIGEQPVVDLQGALLAVTAVAQLGQEAMRALKVTRREVVQHQRVFFEVMCLGAASGILTAQIGEIGCINDFNNEARQMILGEPVIYPWGQQVVGSR